MVVEICVHLATHSSGTGDGMSKMLQVQFILKVFSGVEVGETQDLHQKRTTGPTGIGLDRFGRFTTTAYKGNVVSLSSGSTCRELKPQLRPSDFMGSFMGS